MSLSHRVVRIPTARGVSTPSPEMPSPRRTCLAIGSFDGVHLGHQYLLRRVGEISAEKELHPALLSFYPHPGVVLGKRTDASLLTTLRLKERLLAELGIKTLYLAHFTRAFSQISAEEFVRGLVHRTLGAQYVVLGSDARVGHRGLGTADLILEELRTVGADGEILSPLTDGGRKIGSGVVREMIQKGDLVGARRLLGRSYALEGRVVQGSQRGRSLGFPTANLSVGRQMLPRFGVYSSYVTVGEVTVPAVTNVGVRPTVGGQGESVETHLLIPPERSLYGMRIEISFEHHLREERKFPSLDELQAQIALDARQAYDQLRGPN